MSLDYLEDMVRDIEHGFELFCCQEKTTNDWQISRKIDELKKKAQMVANSRGYPISIYRLVNPIEAGAEDTFFVVRRMLEPGPRGEPRLQWTMVDTKEAAELMRDVSFGPSPYFGACIEDTIEPQSRDTPQS